MVPNSEEVGTVNSKAKVARQSVSRAASRATGHSRWVCVCVGARACVHVKVVRCVSVSLCVCNLVDCKYPADSVHRTEEMVAR